LLQDIRCERLTSDFLAQRQAWIRALEPLTEDDRVDEDAALSSTAATQNSQSSSDARFRSLPTRLRLYSLREADLEVGFEIDLATVTQLAALGYPVARCERAVRATRNAGVDEALDWLFNHGEDAFEHLDALPAPIVGAEAEAEAPQQPQPLPHMSRAVRDLLSGIATLHRGITLSPATTNLTREVFTIFMSRKLPSDVCWLIFSYSASAHDIRAILLDKTFVATGEEYNYYGHYSTLPTLRSQADCVTAAFLRYASHFLHIRHARIAGANTAQ
jgi:hypothetical protein